MTRRATMLAAVIGRYGPPEVVEVRPVAVPEPARGQARVRVRASSLNPLDAKLRSGALRPFLRLRFPAILGFDVAGEVDALGPGVTDLAVGDRVYGRIDAPTGGAHAERAVVAARVLDRIPDRLSFVQAAALPLAGMTALQALRDRAGLGPGQRLLVIGGAGGVGTAAIQIGRALGATVTAVVSPDGRALAERLGAARVLERTAGDLDRNVGPYDVILDTVFQAPARGVERLLAPRGVYVTTGFSPALLWRSLAARLFSRRRIRWLVSRADGEHMRALSALVARGALEAVIDSTWPLPAIRDAHRRLEAGHLRGKIVITLA